MTRALVHRPTRVVRPLVPPDPVDLAPPPQLGEGGGGAPLQALLPVVGAMGSMTMMLVMRQNPLFVLIAVLILVVALVGGVGMALSSRGQQARTRRQQRERYLDHLEEVRAELREAERAARDAAATVHPAPLGLADVVRDPERRWERRRGDVDFLDLRVGTGDRPWFDLRLPADANPTQPYDPAMAAEARSVVARHARVAQMPVTVPLDRVGHVAVVGPRDAGLAALRALLTQAVALHAPEDLHLAVAAPPEHVEDWRWLDTAPHLVDDDLRDGPVAARRVAPDLARLVRVLGPDLTDRAQAAAAARRGGGAGDVAALGPRLLVVADEHGHVAQQLPAVDASLGPAAIGVTLVHLLADRLHEPSDTALRLTVDEHGGVLVEDLRGAEVRAVAATVDDVPEALADGLVRVLAPLRLTAASSAEGTTEGPAGVAELLGVADVTAVDTRTTWAPRSPADFLRVPVGVDDTGAPLLLDLKESAQLGMGPHGLCVGATGSGKSEMLRTLVTALAVTHSPEDLAMILVDYKGGAAFAPFERLPHVAGLIDNLADDAGLTERARASIAGEVLSRQQVLRDAGQPSITHYRELRRTRPDLPPLPHLLVVIDEFGELLTADPDFVDLLLSIGRIGRSIGVHLLLSSQRIEGGKLRGLDTYLSYRLGLRTFSEAESSVVLDTPDAFHLPAVPGYGYLKVDTSVYTRFRAGYVSGPVPSGADLAPTADEDRRVWLLPPHGGLAAANGVTGAAAEPTLERPSVGTSVVDVVVDQLARAGQPVRPVWLDPLPARLALGDVPETTAGHLRVPLGLVDDPSRQRQDPWLLDLTRAGGHVAVIGAPQSGRTTLLWTLAASVARTHTPRHVALYGMDLTGGGLARIEGFPHVGGVATRASRDRLRRLLEELHVMLTTRERVFAARGIDSLAMLRSEHAAGRVPELASADVVLLVDGLGASRTEFEELDEPLSDLLTRGSGFGVHVVATMTRWNELRMQLQPLVGTRLELRLNDPSDSTVNRKLAGTLRADQPGRVLLDQGLFAHVALPVDDLGDVGGDGTDAGSVGAALGRLAERARSAFGDLAAPPIRQLPADLDPATLPDPLDEPDLVPVGLRQDTMGPWLLDLPARDQHLLVLGDPRCGKTTLLRAVVAGLVDRSTPDDLVIALYDPRGTLGDAVPEDYLGGRATTAPLALDLSTAIASELTKRQTTGEGPRIVVVVDDYDILASGGTDPLRPLLAHLPAARDLRLHVVLTRPVAGAGRAMYDPVLQGLRDTGGTGLVMSGERAEGQLFPGTYAEQLPPGRGKLLRRGERPTLVQVAHVVDGGTRAT